jgi:hypothetical protein
VCVELPEFTSWVEAIEDALRELHKEQEKKDEKYQKMGFHYKDHILAKIIERQKIAITGRTPAATINQTLRKPNSKGVFEPIAGKPGSSIYDLR